MPAAPILTAPRCFSASASLVGRKVLWPPTLTPLRKTTSATRFALTSPLQKLHSNAAAERPVPGGQIGGVMDRFWLISDFPPVLTRRRSLRGPSAAGGQRRLCGSVEFDLQTPGTSSVTIRSNESWKPLSPLARICVIACGMFAGPVRPHTQLVPRKANNPTVEEHVQLKFDRSEAGIPRNAPDYLLRPVPRRSEWHGALAAPGWRGKTEAIFDRPDCPTGRDFAIEGGGVCGGDRQVRLLTPDKAAPPKRRRLE